MSTILISSPELVVDSRCQIAESPSWDMVHHRLFWVNALDGYLYIYEPESGQNRAIVIGEPIGCVAPCRIDSAILGLKTGIATVDLSSGRVQFIVRPETHLPGNRFNDGKSDPAGRFLAGTMDGREVAPTGSLYSLERDGKLHRLLPGISVSNGMTWSPDFKTFYYIDTPTRKVMAYDYDLTTGRIANPRIALRVALADGMTSDQEGRLWIALWGTAEIMIWDPKTGKTVETIALPAVHVTSCVFGGQNLNELYVTTAWRGADSTRLNRYPASGGLFRLNTNVVGMPSYEFIQASGS